ncbi:MAG: hypothetical protein ACOY82_03660 [Pseudomonadota bacterium]
MTRSMLKGMAVVCFAAMMGFGGAATAAPLPPVQCTAANDGTLYTVYRQTRWGTESYTYYCNAGYWELFEYCDPATGVCIQY